MKTKTKVIIVVLLVAVLVPMVIIAGAYSVYSSNYDAERIAYSAHLDSDDTKMEIYKATLTCVAINKCSTSDLTKAYNDLYQSALETQRQINSICANYPITFDGWCDNAKKIVEIRLKMLGEGNSTESELQQVSKLNG